MLQVMLALAGLSGAGQVVVNAPPQKPEQKICRRIESTESRIAREKVCKTASEWKLDKQDAERFLTDRQNNYLDNEQRRSAPASQ